QRASLRFLDWDANAGKETCDKINSNGGKATFAKVNVSDRTEVDDAIKKARSTFGRLDSLVASAGIQRYGTAISTDDAQWDEVIGVNLKGAWNAARATIPFLQESG